MQHTASQHILLVCKARHEQAASLGNEMLGWLLERGHTALLLTADNMRADYAGHKPDFVVVLGGDGTLLGVARCLTGLNVPMLGVNFGRVGFLAEARPDDWQKPLTACLEGRAPVRRRLALMWRVLRGGLHVEKGVAVNDVVLSRGALSRLVCLDVSVDGNALGALRSDGLIIASPVGSSGYSASAGGPLLHPSLEALALTPICPFMNAIPPLVFPGTARFRLVVQPGSTECSLTVDGQEGFSLQVGDTVEITGLPGGVSFFSVGISFVERLQARGFVHQGALSAQDVGQSEGPE